MTKYYWYYEKPFDEKNKTLIENEIQKAFDKWSKFIPLDFVQVKEDIINIINSENTIKIGFYSGEHNCENFDGKNGILAHASFTPNNMTSLKIHFDADENWNFTGDINSIINKTNPYFYNIVLHEIGHILGLEHSDNINSIMYKKYSRFIYDLSNEDIIRVQKIHGVRNSISNRKDDPLVVVFLKFYYLEIISIIIVFFLCKKIIKSYR